MKIEVEKIVLMYGKKVKLGWEKLSLKIMEQGMRKMEKEAKEGAKEI